MVIKPDVPYSLLWNGAVYDPEFVDFQTYMTYALAPKWEVNFLGNAAVNNYKFIPHSRTTSFGTTQNIKQLDVVFDGGHEQDRFETYFGAFTLKHKPTEHIELGLQTSASQ